METKEPNITHTPTAQSSVPSDLPLRRWLFLWLLSPNQNGNHHKLIDNSISLLIVFNLIALVAEHIPAIHSQFSAWFHVFDVFSVTIFTVEYLMRLYLAPEDEEFKDAQGPRMRFALSLNPWRSYFFSINDLLAFLPP